MDFKHFFVFRLNKLYPKSQRVLCRLLRVRAGYKTVKTV